MSRATALELHPPPEEPDYSRIVTEDDEPIDGYFSALNMRLLTVALHSSWSGPRPRKDGKRRPFIADMNVGVFPSPYEPPLVPDAFLSLDVALPEDLLEKKNRSYFLNLMGKPPDVVVEIVSNDEGDELGDKKRRYAKMKVPNYVVYDPQKILGDAVLRGFALRGASYARAARVAFEAGGTGFRFDEVGLGLLLWEGVYEQQHATWLRWCLPDGRLVPTGDEGRGAAEKRAEDERKRAEGERKRAEDERTGREAAEKRAEGERKERERLAARLRTLGIDPDERDR